MVGPGAHERKSGHPGPDGPGLAYARPRMSEDQRRLRNLGSWLRVGLGIVGLVAIVVTVRRVGLDEVLGTLRPALAWLPLLAALELGRIGAETAAARIAYGAYAARIPLRTLFRANLIGQSIANLAPAPRMVNETIKATVLAPYVGAAAATSVGVIIQAATLISVGLFSLPCGAAIYLLGGAGVWFWAALIHAIVLVSTGAALRATSRSARLGRWLGKVFPRVAPSAGEFGEHARGVGLFAIGPTLALMGNRVFQTLQLYVAARATGIDTGFVQALAAQGVNLVAAAVGVLVPGGLGTTDGAFTLAAELLGTTAARATALALLLRSTQLVWLAIGVTVLLASSRSRLAST